MKNTLAQHINLKKCLLFVCLILVVVVLLFFSCESFQSKIFNDVDNIFENTISCKYEVAFDFDVAADQTIIEERFRLFNFKILEKEQSGSICTYTIERWYKANDSFFELIATDEFVELIDEEGAVVLTNNDIISAKTEKDTIILKVKEVCYNRFSSEGEAEFFRYSNGEEQSYASCYYKEENILTFFLFEPSTEEERLFIHWLFSLTSQPLKSSVNVKVLSKNVGLK